MHSRGADRRRIFPAGTLAELGIAFDRRKKDDRRSNGFISHLQLFSTIPYEAVEAALVGCVTQDFDAGAVLLEPGQQNHAIHLLVAGRLRIHFDSKDSADYIPVDEGGCFGELSIIDGRPASAYVVADVPSRVLMIDEKTFWDRLIPQPGVARNLLNVLSERMRHNRDIILERMKDSLALEHLQKELAIASTIQLSMLPPGAALLPDHTDVQAYAIMEPAKNVGGDFYDAFWAAPDRLFVAIGDVSGKGVPAALFMARAITQMRMEAVRRRSPAAVLEAVNRALCASNDAGMFVTLFCGVLELQSGRFSFANAGHNPPLLLNAGGDRDFLKVKKGLVAGIIEDSRYPLDTLQFAPGDGLLLYTDGVTEAMDAQGAFYTEERLLATVREDAWADPRAMVDRVRASLRGFVQDAPQADDITMLCLRYCGASVSAPAVAFAQGGNL
ncbi:MAG: SpoIIE family protein phosphatase [Betaproteobacteria bacterium]